MSNTEHRIAILEAKVARLEALLAERITNAVSPQYDARVQNEIDRQRAWDDANYKVFGSPVSQR